MVDSNNTIQIIVLIYILQIPSVWCWRLISSILLKDKILGFPALNFSENLVQQKHIWTLVGPQLQINSSYYFSTSLRIFKSNHINAKTVTINTHTHTQSISVWKMPEITSRNCIFNPKYDDFVSYFTTQWKGLNQIITRQWKHSSNAYIVIYIFPSLATLCF